MKVVVFSMNHIPSHGDGYIEAMSKDYEVGNGYVIIQDDGDKLILYAKSKGQPWLSKKDAITAMKNSKRKNCRVAQLKSIDKSTLKSIQCNVL